MLKVLMAAIPAAMLAMSVTSALAEEQNGALLTGRSVVSCDHEAPVCGVMGKDRLIPYNNECDARQAGAARVLQGQCFDED